MNHFPPIAALDLGSNTFRLMLAEKSGPAWVNKRVFQRIPRLSERLKPQGRFAPEALERAWAAVEGFAAEIRSAGAERVLAGATMAARLAADGPDFTAAIARRHGWESRILSGEEEARLTAAGVLAGLAPGPAEALIFDIGGRSTEFVPVSGGVARPGRSLGLGVVGLTEEHLSAPARPSQLEALAAAIRAALAEAGLDDPPPGAELVGTAGTVTTIASLLLKLKTYAPDRVNRARLARPDVAALLTELAPLTEVERVARYGLHPRRADALPAGLMLALEIMDRFRQPSLMVSDNGLLEGLWLEAAA